MRCSASRTPDNFTIFEGTSEIQRMIIGRAVTGLAVRVPAELDVFARLEGLERGQAEWMPGRVGVDAAMVVWLEVVLRGTGS